MFPVHRRTERHRRTVADIRVTGWSAIRGRCDEPEQCAAGQPNQRKAHEAMKKLYARAMARFHQEYERLGGDAP